MGRLRSPKLKVTCLDYRVPQMLCNLGVLKYSPPLDTRIRRLEALDAGHSWEVQLRGCSIWAVELMRRQIASDHAEAAEGMHAVLLDFLLYDLAKEVEAAGEWLPSHSASFYFGSRFALLIGCDARQHDRR